ncbi:MAG: hypothetical protein KFB94_09265 [Methylophilaceae bacterium]|nr:MAG: hypothetical protein KFB94_09265 [Methylophilaceae bacterium]
MAKTREKQAADAYLKFLQSKGASTNTLFLRSRFLDSLMIKLVIKEQTRKAFAFALEETLIQLPLEDRSNALNTAREYFPFWMDDIKAIAMFHEYYGFSTKEIKWKPKHSTLDALTKNLDGATFNTEENQSLTGYLQALTNLGADYSIIDTRSKLVKIILLRLREAPIKNHAAYRISVDLTLPLFKTKEIRDLYLDVVRDFYHFWENDPNAEALTFGKN